MLRNGRFGGIGLRAPGAGTQGAPATRRLLTDFRQLPTGYAHVMNVFVELGLHAVALLAALGATFIAIGAARHVDERNARSISLKKLTEIQVELTEHADSIASLHASLKKLRSRVGMREKRARELNNGPEDTVPDSRTDPDGYKKAMRIKLRREGLLK